MLKSLLHTNKQKSICISVAVKNNNYADIENFIENQEKLFF